MGLFSNRINRILESPRGSALLVGVGGSGKQSLSRLAAFISSLEVLQIQLKKGYGVTDLKVRNYSVVSIDITCYGEFAGFMGLSLLEVSPQCLFMNNIV